MAGNIRIPPDSTGARVATNKRFILEYDAAVGTFGDDDVVTGAGSGATGTISSIITKGYAANTGRLYLSDVTGTFIENESLEVSATPVATADLSNEAFVEYSFQENVLIDPENPTFKQRLDSSGSSQVTFKSGAPTVGPFGGLIVGEPQTIKDYRFAYDIKPRDFYDDAVTGATITYEANKGTCLLTNPTTTGARATRTSHFYHPYAPGIGQRQEMTIQVGDTGKANVTRRWGYYDDNNGVFWELMGTTIRLCLRSNTTGSVVNTYVDQANFNRDKLDGTSDSDFSIDVSLANIYYIDLQWLGGGRVHFGVLLSEGSAQLVHVIENANISNLPFMRTASLPLRVEQINTGTAGSTSELNWACGVVKHSGKSSIDGDRYAFDIGDPVNVQTSDGNLPLYAFRPKTTLNSIENHTIARLISSSYSNAGSEPLVFRVWITDSTNLTGASWASYSSYSGLEVDTSSTAIANAMLAQQMGAFFVGAGDSQFSTVTRDDSIHSGELYLDADETTQKCFVITADNVGSANTDAWSGVNWMELHN